MSETAVAIPSFREYLLVEPEKNWVRHILVQDAVKGLWEVQMETDLNKAVYLHTIGMALNLSDIYKRVSMLPK